jgi:hypothetical protein
LDLNGLIDKQSNVAGAVRWSLIEPLGGYGIVGELTRDSIFDILAAGGDGEILLLSGVDGRPVWKQTVLGLIAGWDAGYDLDNDGWRDLLLDVNVHARLTDRVDGKIQRFTGYSLSSAGTTSRQTLSGRTGQHVSIEGELHKKQRSSMPQWSKLPRSKTLHDYCEEFGRREGLAVALARVTYRKIVWSKSGYDVLLIARDVPSPMVLPRSVGTIDHEGYSVCILDHTTGTCRWRLDSQSQPTLMGQTDAQAAPLFWVDDTCFAAKPCRPDGAW